MKTIFDSSVYDYEDQFIQEEEAAHVGNMFDRLIEQYEKRYKTKISVIGIGGRMGLWDGNPKGGKFIPVHQNVLHSMGNVDNVELLVDRDTKEFYLKGHHHDGTHIMQIEFLTENKLKNDFPHYFYHGELVVEEAEKLADDSRSKVKYNKLCENYFGKITKDDDDEQK